MLYLNLINVLKEYKKVNRQKGIKQKIKEFKKNTKEDTRENILMSEQLGNESVVFHRTRKDVPIRKVNLEQYKNILEEYYGSNDSILLPKKYKNTKTAKTIRVSKKDTVKVNFDNKTQKKFLKKIKQQVEQFLKPLQNNEPRRKVN